MEKFKSERGSATVVTLTVVLFFTIILMGVYVSANNANRAQKNADTTIIDKYGEDVNYINEIYNEKKLNNVNLNSNLAKVKWNGSEIQYSNLSEAKATAQIDILDENVDLQNCKFIVNNNRNYIGIDDNSWLTSDAVAVTEKSGTVQTTIKGDNTYYIHLLLAKNDNTKEEIISDAIQVSDRAKDVTAKMVVDNPSLYYGTTVTNYTSANGQDDWKIFYSDGTHIFLITSDYVDLSQTDRLSNNTGMTLTKGSEYRVCWTTAPDEMQNITDETSKLFKATGYALNKDNENSRCVSTLLNTSNWTKYLDKEDGTGKANFSIGSPTVEMWMDSWNNLYENIDGKLYYNGISSTGYNIGILENTSSYYIDSSVMDTKKGYNNILYYPHNEVYKDVAGYWMASPSSRSDNAIMRVIYNGSIDKDYNTGPNMTIRPVVCINENQKLDVKE